MNTLSRLLALALLALSFSPGAHGRCPSAEAWAQAFHRDHADFHSAARIGDLSRLTPRFAQLLQREWAYANGEVGHLDHDPWLGAQDGEMAAPPSFTLIADDGHGVSVAMRYPFALDDQGPRTPHEVRLVLVRDAARCWQLDDLVTPRGDSLAALYATPEAPGR